MNKINRKGDYVVFSEEASIINQLYNQCIENSEVTLPSNSDLENEIDLIFGYLKKIQAFQKKDNEKLFTTEKRSVRVDKFIEWCKDKKFYDEEIINVKVTDEEKEEYGLITLKDLKENDLMVKVPRNSMISHEYALNDKKLGPIIKEDQIFELMPNLVLSLLICEEKSKKKDSRWNTFLEAYPYNFNTILYFDLPEIHLLKPSYLFESAIKIWRTICRQYCYFFLNMINPASKFCTLECSKVFTFDLFRWGISVVMSRQNLIPSKQNPHFKVDTLIPLWDFINHEEGRMSTDFDYKTDELKCYAMRNFIAGDEIKMNYGHRSNFHLLLYAGFVYENNTNDFMYIKLGINKNDELFALKKLILHQIDIPSSGAFKLKCKNKIMDSQLIAFLRVFHLSSGDLECLSKQPKSKIENLLDPKCVHYESLNPKINKYLADRAKILIRTYKKKEIEEQLDTTSVKVKNVLTVLSIEKKILESYNE